MSEAKYKVGQEVQTSDGDRHIVEEICYRYVVRRTHAEPVKGVRLTVGAINEYREEDLTPYVRPLEVGDRVRIIGGDIERRIIAISKAEAWTVTDADTYLSRPIADLERIPTETGK